MLFNQPIIFIYFLVYFINILIIFSLILLNFKLMRTNNILNIINKMLLNRKELCYLIIALTSLIGFPPLSGFISKFLISLYIFNNHNIYINIIYYFFIIISVFFYLQVLKLIRKVEIRYTTIQNQSKFNSNFFKKKKNTKFLIFFFLNFFIFFIFFYIFFVKDFIFLFIFILN